MNFAVLPEAQAEAIEAANRYDDLQPRLGTEFLDEIRRAFDQIQTEAGSLTTLETYSGPLNIRRVLLKRYAAIVLVRPDEIVVVAIAHTRRRPLYWLERLG